MSTMINHVTGFMPDKVRLHKGLFKRSQHVGPTSCKINWCM